MVIVCASGGMGLVDGMAGSSPAHSVMPSPSLPPFYRIVVVQVDGHEVTCIEHSIQGIDCDWGDTRPASPTPTISETSPSG